MDATVYDVKGKKKGTIVLSDDVFDIKPNKSAIYYSLKAELANERQGTASTKGRSEVAGSSGKLYRQKGTGRARAGSRRSPIRVGGGVAFGPRPRDYRIRILKKVKRLSVKSLLSLKLQEDLLKVMEDFTVKSGKTRDFSKIMNNLIDGDKKKKVLVLDKEPDVVNKRAGRNIPWVKYYNADLLNTKDLYYATQLIMTESAVNLLNEKYSA
jgi:large subunit ribosomal protein L4